MQHKESVKSGRRKERKGKVLSTKMQKTVVVSVSRSIAHPQFDKTVNRNKKYYAHVDGLDVQEGQVVRIVETRPYSKLKRWRVVEVVR